MGYKITEFEKKDWPPLLAEIPDGPEKLFIAGSKPDYERKLLCIVGSRKYTSYGREACEYLVRGLTGYPITIVSGLALGIDSIAHKSALANGLPTIAIPGSGLHPAALHPQSNKELAAEIVQNGGTLISEMEPEEKASLFTHNVPDKKVFWSFPRRNRIMAGMCHAVLVVEAGLKSGTLITARLTTDYNRELLVVPGSIFSPNSEGSNMLLRQGAAPVNSSEDILDILNLRNEKLDLKSGKNKRKDYSDCSLEENKILELLIEPLPKDVLVERSGLPAGEIQTLLTLLELKGYIKESLGEIRLD